MPSNQKRSRSKRTKKRNLPERSFVPKLPAGERYYRMGYWHAMNDLLFMLDPELDSEMTDLEWYRKLVDWVYTPDFKYLAGEEPPDISERTIEQIKVLANK